MARCAAAASASLGNVLGSGMPLPKLNSLVAGPLTVATALATLVAAIAFPLSLGLVPNAHRGCEPEQYRRCAAGPGGTMSAREHAMANTSQFLVENGCRGGAPPCPYTTRAASWPAYHGAASAAREQMQWIW